MKKLMVLALLVAFMMPLAMSQVFAEGDVVDAGNKFCPVMGGPVNGKDFVVYEGKRYGLCCPGCKSMFFADPAKYIAQTERQETVPVAAEGTVVPIDPESSEMERDMEMGDF